MDKNGVELVKESLRDVMSACFQPRLEEGEDLRYFSVTQNMHTSYSDPVDILNALDESGLMLHGEDTPDYSKPQLRYLGSVGHTHTFEDLSAK